MLPPSIYEELSYKEYFKAINDNEFNYFDKRELELEKYLNDKKLRLEDMKCRGFYS